MNLNSFTFTITVFVHIDVVQQRALTTYTIHFVQLKILEASFIYTNRLPLIICKFYIYKQLRESIFGTVHALSVWK